MTQHVPNVNTPWSNCLRKKRIATHFTRNFSVTSNFAWQNIHWLRFTIHLVSPNIPSDIPSFLSWLVVGRPLWKIWKSIGMMTFQIYGKIKNVPNHQPDINQIRVDHQVSPECQNAKPLLYKQLLGTAPQAAFFLTHGHIANYGDVQGETRPQKRAGCLCHFQQSAWQMPVSMIFICWWGE